MKRLKQILFLFAITLSFIFIKDNVYMQLEDLELQEKFKILTEKRKSLMLDPEYSLNKIKKEFEYLRKRIDTLLDYVNICHCNNISIPEQFFFNTKSENKFGIIFKSSNMNPELLYETKSGILLYTNKSIPEAYRGLYKNDDKQYIENLNKLNNPNFFPDLKIKLKIFAYDELSEQVRHPKITSKDIKEYEKEFKNFEKSFEKFILNTTKKLENDIEIDLD